MDKLLRVALRVWLLTLAGLGGVANEAPAQTDYYNLDQGRPVRIEDAYAKERYAFELMLASLKLDRPGAAVYQWSAEPELAYGIFPRTHVKLGVPIVLLESDANTRLGVAGIDLGIFHNLNAETDLPAFALGGSVLLPAGSIAPEQAYASITLIGTRSFSVGRLHANAEYTFGGDTRDTDSANATHGTNRWLAGIAIDKPLPLHSLLLVADVYAAQAVIEDARVSWNAEAGFRYQINPAIAIDAGVGKELRSEHQGWFVTFGTAYAFGLRSLIPIRR